LAKNTYAVDANAILRYLLSDHPEHFQKAAQFMGQVKLGEVAAFIPEGVLVECVYVLLKYYKVPRSEIARSLENILNYKGIINDNRSMLIKGLRLFQEKNVDIVDALVHTISRENNWLVFTFDKDLERLGEN
jgi:predicted nucleic-acid-binding protein